MRTYVADRRKQERTVLVLEEFEGKHYAKPLKHFEQHSPDGFEWGYAGSGPADLALALCADALGAVDPALEVYQEFKFLVVAGLPWAEWTMEQQYVLDVIGQIRKQAAEASR